jgi:hypothetical protein
MAAEQKTNPRLALSIGSLDLVPPKRRVGGQGASYLTAPFTHSSTDRPTRFSDGRLACFAQPTHPRWRSRRRFSITVASCRPGTNLWVGHHSSEKPSLLPTRASVNCSTCLSMRRVIERPRHLARNSARPGLTAWCIAAFAGLRGVRESFLPRLRPKSLFRGHLDYHRDGTWVDLYESSV